jgi:hypothetical protein
MESYESRGRQGLVLQSRSTCRRVQSRLDGFGMRDKKFADHSCITVKRIR